MSWEKQFDEQLTAQSSQGWDNEPFIRVSAKVVKQFIKDLRKKDEEEIKRLEKIIDVYEEVYGGKFNGIDNIKNLITKEIAEANANGEETSRLTRIYNLIK